MAAVVTCDTIFAAAPVVTGAKVVVGAVVAGGIVVVVVVVGAIVVVVVVVGAIVVVVGAIVVVVVGTVVVVVGAAVVTEAAVVIGAAVVVSTWLGKAKLALGMPIALEYGVNTSTNGFTGRANGPLSPESSWNKESYAPFVRIRSRSLKR